MENKSQFGQPTSFGQTSTFGQITPSFGANTQTSKPSLFGKPVFGTVNPSTFEFNTTSTASNPFTASQPAKPFSQPLFGTATTQAQNTFGAGIFGQTPNQNSTTNLFQKPAQPAGFNTTQSGFSFNQTPATQTSSLFQQLNLLQVLVFLDKLVQRPLLGRQANLHSEQVLASQRLLRLHNLLNLLLDRL